ncbi:unnamed protein product [Symbiodinium sp. CCMP2456]|nr:unnamed protein product [Symbiodinium sp. CCMP2456]
MICVFCKKTSQVVKFTLGNDGTVLNCCFPCGKRVMQLRPGLLLEVIIQLWQTPEADPDLVADYKMATAREEDDDAPEASKTFKPNSSVCNLQEYGWQMFRDFAALTEQEYKDLVSGNNPKDIVKTFPNMSVPWLGPGSSNTTLYAVDLDGLPPAKVASVGKVRIFYGSSAMHSETHLSAENQLIESAGQRWFSHVAGLNFADRPELAQPSSGRAPTVQQLLDAHDDTQRQKALLQQKKLGEDASFAMDVDLGGDSQDGDMQELPEKISTGEGSLSVRPKGMAARSQLKALEKAAAKKKQATAAAPALGDAEDTRSMSKTKKQKLQDGADCLEDEALREVAQEHLRVGGTSVKSLELLKPLEFLHGGPTPQKQLAAALSGAKGIRDRLKEKKAIGAHDVLTDRLRDCEAADVLRQKCENLKQLKSWPLRSMEAHLQVLKDYFSDFPLEFMVCIAFRVIYEGLKDALEVSKSEEESPAPSASAEDFRAYAQAVSLHIDTIDEAAVPWEGLETSVSGVLHLLIDSAVACEKELAAAGGGLAELDVESALQAAENVATSRAAEGLERAVQARFCVLESLRLVTASC